MTIQINEFNGVKLYLCEKPSLARKIAELVEATEYICGTYQGVGTAVMSTHGHLLELASPDEYLGDKEWRIENLPVFPQEWILKVNEERRAQERFKMIGFLMNSAYHVVIATDPDGEGELIARDLLSAHNFKGSVSRLWVSALNTEGLKEALQAPQPLSKTDHLYRAADVRRKLDWLFGMNLTRAFSVSMGATAHIGRVKTQVMDVLIKRDLEIENFKPVLYHTACVKTRQGYDLIFDAGSAGLYHLSPNVIPRLERFVGKTAYAHSVIDDHIEVAPPPPYTFSRLLHDAALYGVGLHEGSNAIQALYEAGTISYPRTSSETLPSKNGKEFAKHSAIVLTGPLPLNASEAMIGIFNLIEINLQLYSKGEVRINRRTVVFNIDEGKFKLHQRWIEPGLEGFVGAIKQGNRLYEKYQSLSRHRPLKNFKVDDELQVIEVEIRERVTTPPNPYTEASLLKMMIDNNIGTEATRVRVLASLEKNRLAVSLPQVDSKGQALSAPAILRSTKWAKSLTKKLPAAILGNDMSEQVKAAQEEAKCADFNPDKYLRHAAKWVQGVLPLPE